MSSKALMLGFIAATILISCCISSTEPTTIEFVGTLGNTTSTTESTTSTTQKETTTTESITTSTAATSTTVAYTALGDWVQAPKLGCECVQWVCPKTPDTTTTTTTTIPTTTTTCVRVPDPDYETQTRFYNVKIRGQKFRPDQLNAFLGDTIIANITNQQGLHRIRETYTNKTITMVPDGTYELIFYALDTGEHLLTCNPFCDEPMEARIIVEEPYNILC